ncbi:hypothetical protein N0V86_002832 [Didymella sp. IMI 355093]|nr:hypothetical protein N0V86_002832 [Didymella sp. IMI 355093]
MSSRISVSAPERVRKRVAEACAFCRRRKTYNKVCSYEGGRDAHNAARARQPRLPVSASVTASSAAHTTPTSAPGSVEDVRSSASGAERLVSVSRIVTEQGMSSYHGRTSTLFDENASHDRPVSAPRPKMPEAWIENALVAEATRQRQLEDYNYRRGILDFDGVDPDLGMHLLNLHWNRQHHAFLVTYRPAFMRDMACDGPYFSKLLLNAIYFGASKFSPRLEVRRDPDDARTAGWQFRKRVRQLLGEALDRSEITTIQALLVMTNSLFALGDERSAAWTYAGIAFRMIVDLGLHVDTLDLASTSNISDEDFEIRRRVFWAAFVVDKIQSLYQGRPVSIKESDTLVPMKFLDTYEELEHWTPYAYGAQTDSYPGSPAFSVSTFRQLCLLSVILGEILTGIYTERSTKKSPTDLSTKLQSIQEKLTAWRKDLPDHLTFNASKATFIPPPHVMSLHADTVSTQSVEQEESLQTPDIDGIIESFMREQENAQMLQTGQHAHNRTQSSDMAPTAPMRPPYGPPPDAQGAYTDDRNGVPIQEYPYGAQQGQYPQQMEGPMTVDDLLYGLNGSALDNYAFLDWEPM